MCLAHCNPWLCAHKCSLCPALSSGVANLATGPGTVPTVVAALVAALAVLVALAAAMVVEDTRVQPAALAVEAATATSAERRRLMRRTHSAGTA